MALAEMNIAAYHGVSHEPLTEPEDGVRHNCGVAAFYFNTPDSLSNLIPALTSLNHRGQEGVGVVGLLPDRTMTIHRDEGLVKDNVRQIVRADADVHIALGHDRYSTSGGVDAWQPFGEEGERIVTAHNGNITNPLSFLNDIPLEERTILSSDTHVLHKALNAQPEESVEERIQKILPRVEGAYSLTIADRDTNSLYLIRDQSGFRPLHYVPLDNGNGYMAASESVAFIPFVRDATKVIEILPGQCIRIDADGVSEIPIDFPETKSAQCIFELVYLGGAASEIFNTNVHAFRRACGENLAEVDIEHGFIPDIIVPIRDSGAAATEGYSMKFIEHLARAGYSPEEIGARIPREALLRNNSVQRTFILPKGRGSAVTEKFTIIPDVVRGKKVVLIDDSVVRGNTMTHLIQMLLDEGASEVHVRSASPPVRHGCYYGVDFSGSDQELIAVGKTEQQIAEIIGAHSIAYINLQDMVGIAKTMSGRENDFCTACFDGNYPVAVNPDLLLGKAC